MRSSAAVPFLQLDGHAPEIGISPAHRFGRLCRARDIHGARQLVAFSVGKKNGGRAGKRLLDGSQGVISQLDCGGLNAALYDLRAVLRAAQRDNASGLAEQGSEHISVLRQPRRKFHAVDIQPYLHVLTLLIDRPETAPEPLWRRFAAG